MQFAKPARTPMNISLLLEMVGNDIEAVDLSSLKIRQGGGLLKMENTHD